MPKHDNNVDHKPHFQSHDRFNGKLLPMMDRELRHLYVHQIAWQAKCCDKQNGGMVCFVSPVVHDDEMLSNTAICPLCENAMETHNSLTVIPIEPAPSDSEEPPISDTPTIIQ